MRKLMMFLSCLLFSIGYMTAQTQKVSGVVLSEDDGSPIIGATVMVQGTSIGTITDIDGNFSIPNVPMSAKKIAVSYIGMKNQVVNIAPNMKINMAFDTEVLDEVIVTGYGTFKKTSFTGSASNMSTEKLQDVPALSVSSKLAG